MAPYVLLSLELAERLIFPVAEAIAQRPLAVLPLLSILAGSALMWFVSLND
ncbi:MAG: hypothetical protein K6T55_03415 [Syntrophobacterales bacterium]|nr:hypothetical protein [Syntrophobacterales bacterium]